MERTRENAGKKSLKIALSAGELSGDEHMAELVTSLKRLLPEATFAGMGGRNFESAGGRLIVNAEQSGSLMGFQEVLASFKGVYYSLLRMKQLIKEWRPDVLVLVDYPDFNLRLAKFAATLKVPVFYYITPKLWAWRKGRVRLFTRYVAQAACIFPFEPEFFRNHGYDRAVYVSHPFSTRYKGLYGINAEEKSALRRSLGLDPDRPTVCFFPGSRKREIKEHLELVADSWQCFKSRHPESQAILAVASSLHGESEVESLRSLADFSVSNEDPISIMRASDAGMIKSGTSNLQAAFCDLPFFMFFKAAPLSAFIAKWFVGLGEYSIVNILRTGTVRELLQEQANPENAADELERILFEELCRSEVLKGLSSVRNLLQIEGESAAERTARLVSDLALAESA